MRRDEFEGYQTMSVRHTGRIEAIVNGQRCQFNGMTWITPDPELTKLLNGATQLVLKGPTSYETARAVFQSIGVESTARILRFMEGSPETRLPDDATD